MSALAIISTVMHEQCERRDVPTVIQQQSIRTQLGANHISVLPSVKQPVQKEKKKKNREASWRHAVSLQLIGPDDSRPTAGRCKELQGRCLNRTGEPSAGEILPCTCQAKMMTDFLWAGEALIGSSWTGEKSSLRLCVCVCVEETLHLRWVRGWF